MVFAPLAVDATPAAMPRVVHELRDSLPARRFADQRARVARAHGPRVARRFDVSRPSATGSGTAIMDGAVSRRVLASPSQGVTREQSIDVCCRGSGPASPMAELTTTKRSEGASQRSVASSTVTVVPTRTL